MTDFEKILSGGDLRSIGNSNAVVSQIHNQKDFDKLFKYLCHEDRIVVMHAADAMEKISINHPKYLAKHKRKLMELFDVAKNKELKWHLALMMPRLALNSTEIEYIWNALTSWARDKTNSRLVRVGAVQGLFEMAQHNHKLLNEFTSLMIELEKEHIPSINARIRNIRKELV